MKLNEWTQLKGEVDVDITFIMPIVLGYLVKSSTTHYEGGVALLFIADKNHVCWPLDIPAVTNTIV